MEAAVLRRVISDEKAARHGAFSKGGAEEKEWEPLVDMRPG